MNYVFKSDKTFGAIALAKSKVKELGFCTGSMERDLPIGVFKPGSYYVGHKWKYVDKQGREELVGIITSDDFRDSDVALTIFDDVDKNTFKNNVVFI